MRITVIQASITTLCDVDFDSLLMTALICRHVKRRKVVRASRVCLKFTHTETIKVLLYQLLSVAERLLIREALA